MKITLFARLTHSLIMYQVNLRSSCSKTPLLNDSAYNKQSLQSSIFEFSRISTDWIFKLSLLRIWTVLGLSRLPHYHQHSLRLKFPNVFRSRENLSVYATASYITRKARIHHVRSMRDLNLARFLSREVSRVSPILFNWVPMSTIVTDEITKLKL